MERFLRHMGARLNHGARLNRWDVARPGRDFAGHTVVKAWRISSNVGVRPRV